MLSLDHGCDRRSAAQALNGLGNKADENVNDTSDGSLLLGDTSESNEGETIARGPRKRPPPLQK